MTRQDIGKLRMDQIDRGRKHAQVQDSGPNSLDEDKTAKITVACNEDSMFLLSGSQQFFVVRCSQADRCDADNIVPQSFQKPARN